MLPVTRSDGAEEGLPSSQDNHLTVPRPLRRWVPRHPLPNPRCLPWPSPSRNRLGTHLTTRRWWHLTTLAQASHVLRTGQSLPPCSAPGLSTTHEGFTTKDSGVSLDRTCTGRLP